MAEGLFDLWEFSETDRMRLRLTHSHPAITGREAHLLVLRWEMKPPYAKRMSLKEVGHELCPPVSPERVRQLETRALRSVRAWRRGQSEAKTRVFIRHAAYSIS